MSCFTIICQLTKQWQHRLEPVKGSYAKEWARWEKRLREVLFGNADYLNSIQVGDYWSPYPFNRVFDPWFMLIIQFHIAHIVYDSKEKVIMMLNPYKAGGQWKFILDLCNQHWSLNSHILIAFLGGWLPLFSLLSFWFLGGARISYFQQNFISITTN